MTALGCGKKRWLKVLGLACLLITVVALALPVWRTGLPEARLTDGSVEFGSNRVLLAAGNWSRGRVTATVAPSKPRETFVLHGDFSGAPPYEISVQARPSGLASRVRLSRGP